jgi:hypothetical protein
MVESRSWPVWLAMFASFVEALFMLGDSHNVTTRSASATINAITGQGNRDCGG